ncbi:MAG: hypothetical protein KDA22_05585 [Phycisphaerales bacterium]|nr:hypothetical protein [Phycisphaerales bacterium]
MPSEPTWPAWWDRELELSAHVLRRMVDRDFSEVDLRRMLDEATGLRPDIEAGRWIVATRHLDRRWEVILEPDESVGVVLVVTAYPVSTSQP